MVTTEQTSSTPPAWDDAHLTDPHAVADKRRRVRDMFAAIAPSYDLNNRLHSLWMDQRWRRKAVKLASLSPNDFVIDVACGTGDLALAIHMAKSKAAWATRLPAVTLGIDFTFEMLPLALKKLTRSVVRSEVGSADIADIDSAEFSQAEIDAAQQRIDKSFIRFINGDAQALPLPNASAEVVSIAFGIRNVQDPLAALKEFRRVLRPGGRVIVLEFSLPTNPVLRGLYNFYFKQILPRTATLISGDKTGAYKYLPQSVNTFIGREQMIDLMKRAGFEDVQQFPMTFGVCVCYRGFAKI